MNQTDIPNLMRLANSAVRERAKKIIDALPDGWLVRFSEPKRTLDQNSKYHAMLDDIVRSGFMWAGRRATKHDLKLYFMSAWMKINDQDCELVEGFEGELVPIYRSTTGMKKPEMSELIDYVDAFAARHGIKLKDAA